MRKAETIESSAFFINDNVVCFVRADRGVPGVEH